MATTIQMPQLGYDMHEGTIVRWRKKEGEKIERGEVLAEIETDKAVVEMEAVTAGIVGRLIVPEGTTVPVSGPIAIITQPGEAVPDVPQEATAPNKQQAAGPSGAGAPTTALAGAGSDDGERVKASPIARKLARELGVDLSQVKASGPGGRITEADVRAFVETAKTAPPVSTTTPPSAPASLREPQRVKLSKMRLAIGRRTAESKRQAPHFYVSITVDMGKALEMRKSLNQALEGQAHITVNDLVVKAAAQALKKFPNLNSTFEEDSLVLHPDINMGIVLAVEQGLIVPAIPQAQDRSLVQISTMAKDLLKRAREGLLKPEEYGGATFAVSNLGMLDVDEFIAVIMPPNSAMLGIGAVKPTPVVRDGSICIAQMMKAVLSVDHRVTDGVEAARYLAEFRRILEEPLTLLV